MPANIYRNDDGKRLKSVTTVTGMFGDKGGMVHAAWKLGVDGLQYREQWGLAAKLGTLVHEACSAILLGGSFDAVEKIAQEVPDTLIDGFANCMGAFSLARKEVNFGNVLASEVAMVSEAYQYGGQPDVALVMDEPAILDFKTGNLYPEHVVQIAAYRQLWNETRGVGAPEVKGGYLLQLNKETGGYQLCHIPAETMDEGWRIFKLLLGIHAVWPKVKKAV